MLQWCCSCVTRVMGCRLLLKRIEALEAKLQHASSTSAAAAAAAAAADVAPAVGTDAAAVVKSFGRALFDKMKGVRVRACVCVFDACMVVIN